MKTSSFKLFGKSIISTFNHHVMALTYEKTENKDNNLTMECITGCPDKMINGIYSTSLAVKIAKKNRGKCDIFIFKNNIATIGTLSVMYKGGDDVEYKIRSIDAFIYNVFVIESFRGKGYAVIMIRMLMEYLHEKAINKAYLAVSTNNKSAIKCYQKVGFITEYEKSFIRILKVNVPYKTI